MFKDIVKKNRSYRRFDESKKIDRETLVTLVDYARMVPSGANKQVLKYLLSYDKAMNDKIFPTLGWAGYLKDWSGPVIGERPSAYIVILQDDERKMPSGVDHGIAAQTILLGAVEMGLGGCMIGNIQHSQLREALNISENYEILLIIAIGQPKETVVIDEIDLDGDIKYWRDANQVHHVPKFKLKNIIIN